MEKRPLSRDVDRPSEQRSLKRRIAGVTMPITRKRAKWGRNWLCLCGSKKKYKNCCMKDIEALDNEDQNARVSPIPQEMVAMVGGRADE